MEYEDFIVRIGPSVEPERYAVSASSATEGEAHSCFAPPFDETQLENFVLRVGLTRRGVRRIHSQEWEAAQAFGQRLYNALFCDELHALFIASRNAAHRNSKGLRVKIVLDAPALANYPWEYLYDPTQSRFLTLFEATPIVRYIELNAPLSPLHVAPPLRVLVLASSPVDFPPLDIQREHANLSRALQELQTQGLVALTWLENATVEAFRDVLLRNTFHIFHFIGHGGFDPAHNDGILLFEDDAHKGRRVSAERISILLGNHPTLRLAILNACEGARTSVRDPFAGAAMTLVRSAGIPAVVAMQFEITDDASIAFSRGLYGAIAAGRPVDAAVTQARLAVFADDNDVEWGTPVLYLRAPDGIIFSTVPADEAARLGRERAERQERLEAEQRTQAEHDRQERERVAREQAERERAEKMERLYQAARSNLASDQLAEAITTLDELLAIDPNYPPALELSRQVQAAQTERARQTAERAEQARVERERLDAERQAHAAAQAGQTTAFAAKPQAEQELPVPGRTEESPVALAESILPAPAATGRRFSIPGWLVAIGIVAFVAFGAYVVLPTLSPKPLARPTVMIQSPPNGAQFREGEVITVQSTSRDPLGIARVELVADGAVVRVDGPPTPAGPVEFTLVQQWMAAPGGHTLSVRAFSSTGAASDPAIVSVTVMPAR